MLWRVAIVGVLAVVGWVGFARSQSSPRLARDPKAAGLGLPLELPAAAGLGTPLTEGVAPTSGKPEALAAGAGSPPDGNTINLARLWEIAQERQPELLQALAMLGEAQGRQIQAGKYPNPQLMYLQELIGSRAARQGDFWLEYQQTILTAGKFRLDKSQAAALTDAASLAVDERRFEVLTRVRRAYFDYVGLAQETVTLAGAVKALEKRLTEAETLLKAKLRSKTDVITLELLLEEVKVQEIKTQAELNASWGQLAAEVGAPDLPPPSRVAERARPVPAWSLDDVESEVRQHSGLRRARMEAEGARLAMLRARAEAIPNIMVGGGYRLDNTGNTAGGIITFQVPLAFWDRKQGKIREAEAAHTRSLAAARTLELDLLFRAREAWGRFTSARDQLYRLNKETLPRLKTRAELVEEAYKARAENVNFNDVFQAEQALFKSQVEQFQVRRSLWRAIADLQGLLQVPIERDPEAHE